MPRVLGREKERARARERDEMERGRESVRVCARERVCERESERGVGVEVRVVGAVDVADVDVWCWWLYSVVMAVETAVDVMW